jgi:hypothetical protein
MVGEREEEWEGGRERGRERGRRGFHKNSSNNQTLEPNFLK